MRNDYIRPEIENKIATEIMHVSRRLLQRSARAIENLKIGAGQLPILKVLSDFGTMTQRQIAEEIRVTPATICGTIKRMERSGLIRREPSTEDARVLLVSLTEEGRQKSAQALQAVELPYGEMFRGFNEEECRQVQDFVRRMGENLTRAAEEGWTDEDRND